MSNANIALILDASYSMRAYNYFSPAQTDEATFVNIMRPRDGVGLVAFSDNAWIFFPTNGASQLVTITGIEVQNQAVQAILGQTTHNNTNMKAAIAAAHGMLASASQPRAMVLLSDGEANVGGNPLDNLPTDIPIHTIALGPSAGISTLQQIAYRTIGQGQGYHYAPNAWDLAEIYNHIVQTTGVSNTVLNAQTPMPNYNFRTQPLTVSGGQSEARVAVNWTDARTVYTPGTPVGAQINVVLRDPNGTVVQPTTTATGSGFVVFSVANPVPGDWQVGMWSAQAGGAGATLQTVAGGFEPDSQTVMSLAFEGDAAKAGSPAGFRVDVTHEGKPVPDVHITAVADAPLVSFAQALERHKDAFAAIQAPEGSGDRDRGALAKLAELHRLTPDGSVLPRETYPLEVVRESSGSYRGSLSRTAVPGPHTIRVTATGRSPVDGSVFRRTGRVSVNLG